MAKFEYKTCFIGDSFEDFEIDRILTEWGEGGWDFTGYVKFKYSSDGSILGRNYFMKRKVQKSKAKANHVFGLGLTDQPDGFQFVPYGHLVCIEREDTSAVEFSIDEIPGMIARLKELQK